MTRVRTIVCGGSGYVSGELLRIGTPPIPIASARSLKRQILPDEAGIVERILDMI